MWKSSEINKLKELYSDNYNYDIGVILDKSKSAIDNKAHRLGLKKSDKLLKKRSELGGKVRIMKGGRDLSFDNLSNIAINYKSRIEFIRGDGSAYTAALNMGCLDSICEHMSVIKFSTPQLILQDILNKLLSRESKYNDRLTIKPYEIDVYYEEYKLGFEYQGSYWHGLPNNDELKSKMCLDIGVSLIYIYEDTRDYELDIKNQVVNVLDEINKITNNTFTSDDVFSITVSNINDKLYNKSELLDVVKKYTLFSVFKEKEKSVYRKLLKLNMVDEATIHMVDKKIINRRTDNEIRTIVNNYNNLTDFRKSELSLYKNIKRLKKDYLIEHLETKKQFTIDNIIDTVSKYKLKSVFIKNNSSMYRFIRRNKLIKLLSPLMG